MKFSESWLREWVNVDLDTNGLVEVLTLAGLEVDAVEDAAASFDNVVVGKILDVKPHPNADRLRICSVDSGEASPLTIVCGAPNAAAGLTVPLAKVGAELPGGLKIKAAEVRGEPSAGMLCAGEELGISGSEDGLWELPADLVPGTDLREALQLNDKIIEIDLTPNRGDCLSIRGVARDVAACTDGEYLDKAQSDYAAQIDKTFTVEISDADSCPRYAGRVIEAIDAKAATPLWMAERLRRSGIGTISLPVDITNYVMLELGQPMHAFDRDKLQGRITVRLAVAGEEIVLLDDQKVTLDESTLVIADEVGPVAIAGVMGGKRTAVDDSTKNIFLESACFAPAAVAGQGRRYKIHTDSLHRFERGVDPELQSDAIERATALLIENAGGQAGPTVVTGSDWQAPTIDLRSHAISRLLGTDIPNLEVTRILQALGLNPTETEEGWSTIRPGWRYDLAIEADLIEEVARVHGYHRLPAAEMPVDLPGVAEPRQRCERERAREVLVQRGYHEAVGYTFVESAAQQRLGTGKGIVLDNPIAEQFAEMRTSLWASLLPLLSHNLNRQQSRVRLFEMGRRFLPLDKNCANEQEMIAGIVCGSVCDEQWDLEQKQVDIYDVRGDVEALVASCGLSSQLGFEQAEHPALHPGQAARILLNGEAIGWLGALNPSLLKSFNIKQIPILFEVSWEILSQQTDVSYKAVPAFPSVRRDLALVVPDSVPAAALIALVEGAGESILERASIFDLYQGDGVEQGFKSIALGLIFQEKTRTLTDSDVEQAVARLQGILEKELGATIRN